MNEISQTFSATVSSQRIKAGIKSLKFFLYLDFIEDEIRNSALNIENANDQLVILNQKTENYRGIYYWLCIFSFFFLLIIAFIFYYKYYYNQSQNDVK